MTVEEIIIQLEDLKGVAHNVGSICFASNKAVSQTTDKSMKKQTARLYVASQRSYGVARDIDTIITRLRTESQITGVENIQTISLSS